MQHFKDLLIKLQTLDIRIEPVKDRFVSPGTLTGSYSLSHENPYLTHTYKSQLKALKELAITDILNLPIAQIKLQLERLNNLSDTFQHFWDRYYNSKLPPGSEYNLDLIFSLNLNDIFICPFLSFADHARAADDFIEDLETTIRFRQKILEDFEEAVGKVISSGNESTGTFASKMNSTSFKSSPIFKEGILPTFFEVIREHFAQEEHERLKDLLTSRVYTGEALVFNGAGNKLADAFKQLYDSQLIVGCNKAELENWIFQHFQYRDNGLLKSYTEKYLQDMISGNTKACQSPLLDVRKMEDEFTISPVIRNNKNRKK